MVLLKVVLYMSAYQILNDKKPDTTWMKNVKKRRKKTQL